MPIGAGDETTLSARPRVGVLALQGAFATHCERLESLGVEAPTVRTPADLTRCDALVLPGGESTTMSRLLTTSGLFDALKTRIADGMPTFGTCAGLILLSTQVLGARPDQRSFDRIDLTTRRNGYGRQLDSFEAELDVTGLDAPFHAVFIRAPLVERVGADVEVLAEHEGVPVLLKDGTCTVAAFHPELTADARLHEMFISQLPGAGAPGT
jgi:5'-phosphate synthase pdxT subunit